MNQVKTVKQRLTNDKIIVLSIIAVAMFLTLTITVIPVMAAPVMSDSLAQFIMNHSASPDMRTEMLQSAGEAVAAGVSDAEIMQIITDCLTGDNSGKSVADALEALTEANDGSEMKDSSMAEANDDVSEMKDNSMVENEHDDGDHGSDSDDGGSGSGDGGGGGGHD